MCTRHSSDLKITVHSRAEWVHNRTDQSWLVLYYSITDYWISTKVQSGSMAVIPLTVAAVSPTDASGLLLDDKVSIPAYHTLDNNIIMSKRTGMAWGSVTFISNHNHLDS